jgi:hypothetical protein
MTDAHGPRSERLTGHRPTQHTEGREQALDDLRVLRFVAVQPHRRLVKVDEQLEAMRVGEQREVALGARDRLRQRGAGPHDLPDDVELRRNHAAADLDAEHVVAARTFRLVPERPHERDRNAAVNPVLRDRLFLAVQCGGRLAGDDGRHSLRRRSRSPSALGPTRARMTVLGESPTEFRRRKR